VISDCAINHAPDKAAVWREIHRILRPGGQFVVSDVYAVDPVAPEWRADPLAVAECWAGAELREEVLSHVAAAGLCDVRVVAESAPYDKGHARVASFTLVGRKPESNAVGCEGGAPISKETAG
jgi:SAM-dependent methyltransferase